MFDISTEHATPSGTGFLGSTSFQSAFKDYGNQLDVSLDEGSRSESGASSISTNYIYEGIKVISVLRYHGVITRIIRMMHDWRPIDLLCRMWYSDLWQIHADTLQSDSEYRLKNLVQTIFSNTAQSRHTSSMTMREYVNVTSGVHLRWEVIGMILAEVVYRGHALASNDPLWFDSDCKVDRLTFVSQCREAVEMCIGFCELANCSDELYLWMVLCSDAMLAVTLGETAPATYIRGGKLVSIALNMGVHQSCRDANVPQFLVEFRKYILMAILNREASRAVTLGRPPRLHYKYCELPELLDIPSSTWLEPQAIIDDAISRLQNGWNTDGTIFGSTWQRRALLLAKQRMDIVDLALLPRPAVDLLLEAERISNRIIADFQSLPLFLQSPHSEKRHGVDLIMERFCRKIPLMGISGNQLLLQRILVDKGGLDSRTLIPPARDILDQVIPFVTSRDIPRGWASQNAWVLITYGIRAAAILALELFKQSRSVVGVAPEYRLARGKTVRDLSVFVSCCESIEPSYGDWQVCQQAARIVKKTLDAILSPEQYQFAPNGTGQSLYEPSLDEILGIMPSQSHTEARVNLASDAEFIDWLKGLSWNTA